MRRSFLGKPLALEKNSERAAKAQYIARSDLLTLRQRIESLPLRRPKRGLPLRSTVLRKSRLQLRALRQNDLLGRCFFHPGFDDGVPGPSGSRPLLQLRLPGSRVGLGLVHLQLDDPPFRLDKTVIHSLHTVLDRMEEHPGLNVRTRCSLQAIVQGDYIGHVDEVKRNARIGSKTRENAGDLALAAGMYLGRRRPRDQNDGPEVEERMYRSFAVP